MQRPESLHHDGGRTQNHPRTPSEGPFLFYWQIRPHIFSLSSINNTKQRKKNSLLIWLQEWNDIKLQILDCGKWFYSSLSNKHWLHNSAGIKMTRLIFILVVYNLFMMAILSATRNGFKIQHKGSTSAKKKRFVCHGREKESGEECSSGEYNKVKRGSKFKDEEDLKLASS